MNYFKLFLFVGLFIALCAIGGDLCSADGRAALAELVAGDQNAFADKAGEFEPLRPREREFRGISPWPDFAARLPAPKRAERTGGAFN